VSDDFSSAWALGWPAAGSVVAGYRLEDRIGEGGMAVVYRAHDVRLNRRVAVKLLAPALAGDPGFRQRFTGEALAAAAVDDPHIIPVFEAGEAGGVLFIAMRYVGGGDVLSLVRREGPLELPRAAAIISPVASALDAAHAAGLVHRDVKPANMLLDVRPGRPDHVYLSDFGLSKASLAASGLTGTGHFIGTLDYISPEQIEGRPVDGRADQYALACAAFEMLAGAPPFPRDQGLAVVAAHLSTPAPLVRSRRPGLPGGVDRVLARALAKAPDDRFASCGDFAEALRAALGLAPYDDAGSASRPSLRTPTQVATPPAKPAAVTPGRAAVTPGPAAVTPEPAAVTPEPAAVTPEPAAVTPDRAAVTPEPTDSGPPGPGTGDRPAPQTGSPPDREGSWAATVDASRVAAQPRREQVPPAPGPEPGYPAVGIAARDKAPGPGPDQGKGWRPNRRVSVIAAAGAALAAAAIIALVISLRPAPTDHGSASAGHRSAPASHGSTPVALALPPSTAYVANYSDNTVTPIDVATGSAGTPIKGLNNPGAIAITPDGKTAYVANYDGKTVTPIDLATGSAGTPIQVGSDPEAIAITPDGKTAYVVLSPDNGNGTVTPIDLATGSAGTAIQVGQGPDAIAITPDGKTAYVVNNGSGTVTPIDLATGSAGTAIQVGNQPDAVAFTPDGTTAYVVNSESNSNNGTVTPIDVATGIAGTPIQVGQGPDAIAITPDGKTAYVANYDGTTGVTPIDLATGIAGTQIPGRDCGAIAVTPDGKTVYFVSSYNGSDGTVTPIDVATGSEGNPIQVGNGPVAIAFTP
jgi:YVTN family beta-propeller protein